MATKGTSVSQTKTTGNPRKQVTAEAQKYASEESKKFYSGVGKSILDAGIALLGMVDKGRKIQNGTLKEKAETAQELLETDIAVINAAIHPGETWEGIKAEVKNTMDEKGGSYIAGYVAGDAMIGAVGGLIGKEAGVVDDMLRVSKGSTKTRKWEQIVEKIRTKKTTKSTGNRIKPEPGSADFIGPLREVDAARASDWTRPDGSTWWPPNNGAVPGSEKMVTLRKGSEFGRIGANSGSYVAPPNTSPERLALKPGTDVSVYNEYRVIKDIPQVQQAEVAAWFDMPGGGVQYKLPASINELMEMGYIELIIK